MAPNRVHVTILKKHAAEREEGVLYSWNIFGRKLKNW